MADSWCATCGTEIAPGLLTCPGCHRLVHADQLKELAAEAEQSERDGDLTGALRCWNEAHALLPPASKQYGIVTQRIATLGRAVDRAPVAPAAESSNENAPEGHADSWGARGRAGAAGLGAIGLALFKFKFVAFFLLTKAKFLLMGLTKASTLFSMLATIGVYWAAFGWWFALGLVVSIYVHEMGHVYVLNRYGIKASAPMFVPGFGAFIRLQQRLTDVRQDARSGLAGPIWGSGAALAFLAGAIAFESPAMAAIAQFGAVINLFNLIPLGSLDGGRAFRALSRSQRWLAAAALGSAWAVTEQPLLVILILVAAYRALCERGPTEGDRGVLLQYAALVAVLSALMMIPVAL